MADLIFYQKVVSLDSRAHQDLRIKPLTGYAFAGRTNSVPVVGVEFADTAREYPVAFVKSAEGTFLPVAVLGLRENENLFVADDGRWDARYIPAFVRRYPFAPADVEQGGTIVCIDESAACLDHQEGERLFDGDKPSPYLQNVFRLLQDYQAAAVRTQEFCRRLQDSNLLVESNARAQLPDGASFNLSGLFVVDEKRLQVLDKEKVLGLFSSGELGLIYAHLMSLGNLQQLVQKLGARLGA